MAKQNAGKTGTPKAAEAASRTAASAQSKTTYLATTRTIDVAIEPPDLRLFKLRFFGGAPAYGGLTTAETEELRQRLRVAVPQADDQALLFALLGLNDDPAMSVEDYAKFVGLATELVQQRFDALLTVLPKRLFDELYPTLDTYLERRKILDDFQDGKLTYKEATPQEKSKKRAAEELVPLADLEDANRRLYESEQRVELLQGQNAELRAEAAEATDLANCWRTQSERLQEDFDEAFEIFEEECKRISASAKPTEAATVDLDRCTHLEQKIDELNRQLAEERGRSTELRRELKRQAQTAQHPEPQDPCLAYVELNPFRVLPTRLERALKKAGVTGQDLVTLNYREMVTKLNTSNEAGELIRKTRNALDAAGITHYLQ